jgi:uncharacterized protein (TIGR02147 family)
VFDFRDYRAFLKEWLSWKRQQNPHYTGAMFARLAGLKAHTILGMVIRGERNLGYEAIRGFSRAVNISGSEALYFEKLVLFNQAKTGNDRRQYFTELLAASRPDASGKSGSAKAFELLSQINDHASYLSHWYVVAIREMIELADFREDPEWIAARLKNRVGAKQVKQAIELLLKIGLIARERVGEAEREGSRLVIRHPVIDIDPGGVDFAIQSYHKQFLDLGKEAIDHDPKEDRDTRDFSSLTLSVSDADLERLRKRLQELRKQLNLEFASSKEGPVTRTVAVNFQTLLLTSSPKPPASSRK